MADGIIQVPPDDLGKKVDTSELTVGAVTVERQRINISDPAVAAAHAKVENTTPGATDYGLVVREAQRGQQVAANSIPVVIASDQSTVQFDPQGPDAQAAAQTGKPLQNSGRNYSDGKIYTIGVDSSGVQQMAITGTVTMALPAQPFLNVTDFTDVTAASPTRGDLITAQGGTPKWNRLALGANNTVLQSNGLDDLWSLIGQSNVTNGYVDLSSAQASIAGNKTFTGTTLINSLDGILACSGQGGVDIVAKCNNAAFAIQGGLNGSASGTVLMNPGSYSSVATQLDGVDNVHFIAEGVTLNYAASYNGIGLYWRNVGHGGIRGNIKLNGPGSVLAVPSAPALSTSTSGGSIGAGVQVCAKLTLISSIKDSTGGNTGETTASSETCITTGAGATNSVTVTAPALPTGAQGYTVYSGPTTAEKQQAASNACVNISANCVIQVVGAGASAPSTNTAIHPSICLQVGIGSGGTNSDTNDNIFDHIQCNGWGRMFVGEGSASNGTYGNTVIALTGGAGGGSKSNGIGLYLVPTSANDFNLNNFYSTDILASVNDCARIDGSNGNKFFGIRCEANGGWAVNFLGSRTTNYDSFYGNWHEGNTLGDFRSGSATNVTNITILDGPTLSSPAFSSNWSGPGNLICTSSRCDTYVSNSTIAWHINSGIGAAFGMAWVNDEGSPSFTNVLGLNRTGAGSGAGAGNLFMGSTEYPVQFRGDITATNNTATGLKIPVGAGLAPTVSGNVAYDSTANQYSVGVNGTNRKLPIIIASGTSALTTAAIATGACGTTVTTAATGAATTDAIDVARNAAPTNANGGQLTLNWWVTSGNVNFNYCNPTAGSLTPTAMTVNWVVRR